MAAMTAIQLVVWLGFTVLCIGVTIAAVASLLMLSLLRRHVHNVEGYLRVTSVKGEVALEKTTRVEERIHEIGHAVTGQTLPPGVPPTQVQTQTPKDKPRQPPVTPAVIAALVMIGVGTNTLAVVHDPREELPVTTAADTVRVVSTGLAAMKNREYLKAAELLERAAEEGADPTVTLGAAAECRFYLRQYDVSLALCDRLSAAVPNCGRAHTVRGLVLLQKGDRAGAGTQFRAAARHGDQIALTLIPKA